MKLINPTLTGCVFIGLVGCTQPYSDVSEYVYKGFHYVVKTTSRQGGSSFTPHEEIQKWLYVCKNGQWEIVRDDGGIKFIEDHGRFSPSSVSGDVSSGGKCYDYPKKPKKEIHTVARGDPIVPKVTGTDGFEGGD
jgi:hypothetical protein